MAVFNAPMLMLICCNVDTSCWRLRGSAIRVAHPAPRACANRPTARTSRDCSGQRSFARAYHGNAG
jgi:hypothetical protein